MNLKFECKVEKNDNKINEIIESVKDALQLSATTLESNVIRNFYTYKAVDTGRAVSSVTSVINENDLSAEVGSNVEYVPYIEFGTVKMPARPIFRNAFYENIEKIKQFFIDSVKK